MTKILLALLARTSIGVIAIATAMPALAHETDEQPAAAATAVAQDQTPPSAEDEALAKKDEKEIVVTGTQIRGIKPVGSNVIDLSSETMKATGVLDSNQILAQLPQSNFFNMFVEPGNGVAGAGTVRIPITRPNLRNIPVGVSGSGALTLVLMDGHRIVPAGLEQSVVDAGVVPPGLLDRLEVILDGASAVYGSDAVAGVLNYIPRKRYDGVQISGRYGIAEDYWQADTGVTVGKTWGTGGISFNYEFAKSSTLLRGDRKHQSTINWVTALDPVTGTPTGTQNATGGYVIPSGPPAVDDLTCDIPNVRNNGQTNTFHVSGTGLAPNPQFCDASAFSAYNPASRRHSIFAVLQQDLSKSLKFDVTAFYVDRLQQQNSGPARSTANIATTNPYYRCNTAFTGTCTGTTALQRVSFSYGPLLGNDFLSIDTTTSLWQVTPQFTARLGSDWQARALFVYGESAVTTAVHQLDTTLQAAAAAGTTTTTALNPYDITAATNVPLVNSFIWDDIRKGEHRMANARVIADGSLFTLPGGNVRASIGAEWVQTDFKRRSTNISLPHERLAPVMASASSKSVFGEVVVPVFGDENGGPGLESLILSASGRYDTYGHGIDTFNPKLAATFKPLDWVTFRGNWGTSFRGPNASDKLGASATTIRCIGAQTGCTATVQNIPSDVLNPATNAPYPSFTATGNRSVYLTLGGTDANLRPETSTSWSVGGDIEPPFVPGLTLSATYWNIDFKDIVNLPQNSGSLVDLFRFLPSLYTVCRQSYATGALNQCAAGQPLNAALQTYLGQASGAQAIYDQAIANGLDVVYLTDTRIRNLGQAKVKGVDASASYRHTFGFGSVDLAVNGAWLMKATLSFAAGAPLVDQIEFDNVKFRMTSRLGVTVGNLRVQGSFRHQSGFTPRPQFINGVSAGGSQRLSSQTRIPSFDVVDLAVIYNVNGPNLLKDLSFSLNVNNILDVDPPLAKTAGGGTAGGFNAPIQTLGRFIQFGITKRFR